MLVDSEPITIRLLRDDLAGYGLALAGVKMAVSSNGPRAKMDITLTRTGRLDQLAPRIYSAQDLAYSKPGPQLGPLCDAIAVDMVEVARLLGV